MNERENVIKGLECCSIGADREPTWNNLTARNCGKCPYNKPGIACTRVLSYDALSLLKAQEPRVMTLEEVNTWIKTDTLDRNPIYFEKRGFAYGEWIDPFEDFDGADIVGYGSDVLCWTSRPTDEQREAVKWE